MARRQLVRTPLHRQVADQLRQDIARRHQPGERLPSEASLATQFAVSLVTIREALSALAQQGLLERRHGSGTYVSERSVAQHIAIVSEMDLGSSRAPYFQLRVVHRLIATLGGFGWPVQLYLGNTAPGAAVATPTIASGLLTALAERRVAGVMAISTLPTSDMLQRAADARIPVIGDDPTYPISIGTDMAERIRQGIRRLVDGGRRRIAVQAWDHPGGAPGVPTHGDIVRGELAACGIPVRPGWLVTDLHPHLPGSGHRGFERMWTAEAEKPDGLLLCDDHFFPEAAMGIVGRRITVPDELQVVAFTNAGSGMFSPFGLTTLEIDPDQVADAGAALMQQLLRGEVPERKRVLVAATWGRLG